MGQGALIDTNVISDYLQGNLPASGHQYVRSLIIAGPNISVVTQIELLAWNVSQILHEAIQALIDNSRILPMEHDVVISAAAIRKMYKLKLPDAVIAATAATNHLLLVTRDGKDFDKVPHLQTINPWEL